MATREDAPLLVTEENDGASRLGSKTEPGGGTQLGRGGRAARLFPARDASVDEEAFARGKQAAR